MEITNAQMAIQNLPESQKDDLINIISAVIRNPTVNPYRGTCANHAYYNPKAQRVMVMLEAYGQDMDRIPHIGPKITNYQKPK